MKTSIAFLALLLVASPLLAVSTTSHPGASHAAAAAAANRLQITVRMPASLNIIWSDNLADSFASLVTDTFKQDGFRGHMTVITAGDQPRPDVPTLEINLIDWHVNLARAIDCTISAVLKNANGEESLGLFTGSSLGMFDARSPFERAAFFDTAASQAIDQLYGELRQKQLLPAKAE